MSDKKRIAKNSLYLYARMLLMMGVSLYTSRVILENLGVEDFGIFSAVGGVAVIFSFFNNALCGSTQRFITVSIGKDSVEESRKVYSMSMNCHIIICLVILVLSETIGLWFLNSELNIPPEKMGEANWVFQFALVSCLTGVISVPFSGCIIAYEKMSFFAMTSIISALLKLAIAWIIILNSGNRLVLYSLLLAGVSIIMTLINYVYCRLNFDICRFVVSRSRELFRSMMAFTGWNLFKMGAVIGVSQGNNIIVNIFGGPVASAAISIANQVNGTIYNFMQNVQTAFNPQITKTVAVKDMTESLKLINLSARYSFMLLCFAGVPLILQMSPILHLWLTEVPDSTSTLCIFSICSVGLDALVGPIGTAVFAIGNIKRYQIITSILWAIAIPAAWAMMTVGIEFKYILVSKIIAQAGILMYSLVYLKRELGLSVCLFVRDQFIRPFIVAALTVAVGVEIINLLHFSPIINVLFTVLYTTPVLAFGFFIFSMEKNERNVIGTVIKTKFLSYKSI